ncbi:MAG TPA: hypothetical protein DCQ66_02475, partial [Gammaproteobacteria bacterium]|nr:hypothetical protein [Gammaproteobacteria bacterium]
TFFRSDWIYNEYLGTKKDKKKKKNKWEDVPEDWVCPDCGASKDQFEMIEIE